MPRYVGASLRDVRGAIKKGLMRFVQSKHDTLYSVRGGGAKDLSPMLLRRLLKRWWEGGVGTKLVVGWVHSDAFYGAPPQPPRIETMVVTRPAREHSIFTPRDIFQDLVTEEAARRDPRIVHASFSTNHTNTLAALMMENINNNNNEPETFHTNFFVWPAGIIVDNRLSSLTNILHAKTSELYNKTTRRVRRMMTPEEKQAWATNVVRRRFRAMQQKQLVRGVYRVLPAAARLKVYNKWKEVTRTP